MKIEEYKEWASEVVSHYQTDLDIDLEYMAKGTPALICLRSTGSHMVTLDPPEVYPAPGETVKYLFGSADRNHILSDKVSTLKTLARSPETICCLYFDGEEVLPITPTKTLAIVEEYHKRILNSWK